MAVHITEENVVQQIKIKNEESLSFVLATYGGLLKAIIRKYLNGNQQDMEECLADVIVSIWYHIDSFDPEKNEFKQWIAAIAKYKAIDYVRKTKPAKQIESSMELNDRVSNQAVSESSELVDMNHLFNELSEVEREIFKKYYVEGVPSNEIANQFQRKVSWVHNKLSRGRKRLKNFLLRNGVQ